MVKGQDADSYRSGCKKCPQNVLLFVIGITEIVAAACALTALRVNSLILTSADGDMYYTYNDLRTKCGYMTADIESRLDEFQFDAEIDMRSICADYVQCSDIEMGNNCKSSDTYHYKRAKKEFCGNSTTGSKKSKTCTTAKLMTMFSKVYMSMATIGYIVLICTGVFLIVYALIRRYYCGITGDGENEGGAAGNPSENLCLRCCTSWTVELIAMIINFVCACLFVVGFGLFVAEQWADDDDLDGLIEDCLNDVYSGKHVDIDWTVDNLKDGKSVFPMAAAFCICYVIFSYMAITAFCTSLHGCCHCCFARTGVPEAGHYTAMDDDTDHYSAMVEETAAHFVAAEPTAPPLESSGVKDYVQLMGQQTAMTEAIRTEPVTTEPVAY